MRTDLKKDRKDLYQPSARDFTEVVVPPTTYLAVDGHGDPSTAPEYAVAVETLYTMAYAVRAALRARTGDDFVVGPLEGLWTSDDPGTFVRRDKSSWDWTMLIPLPDSVIRDDIDAGIVATGRKSPDVATDQVATRTLDEGRCLQIMHLGSYDDEGPTLARLHDTVMPQRGLTFNGPHHEIYLSDARRVAPDKLKTVLRQPVRPA